ncbi:type II toxin-antitoxin system VapC family toxin [Victivallis sp. Marseille-Q1083]|uniref:type II toxin-antitoxin system VapC family toxin n=1 Tax=Victivallis sp. Marseille-Q1083 TaxID=2717288 RepID=UPI001C37BC5E|nr:type II toxin-antitoxin system VapC family toxin [Victivallis sp. Marseille-Q1083]
MKKLYMLDTDTCSYIIKGANRALIEQVKAHKNQLCISSITLAELLFGAAKKNSPRLTVAVDLFQQLVDVRPWHSEAAVQYAMIRQQLELSGTPIGNMDMLIAASAMAEKACLVTNNTAHFSRISKLKLENWCA